MESYQVAESPSELLQKRYAQAKAKAAPQAESKVAGRAILKEAAKKEATASAPLSKSFCHLRLELILTIT